MSKRMSEGVRTLSIIGRLILRTSFFPKHDAIIWGSYLLKKGISDCGVSFRDLDLYPYSLFRRLMPNVFIISLGT